MENYGSVELIRAISSVGIVRRSAVEERHINHASCARYVREDNDRRAARTRMPGMRV